MKRFLPTVLFVLFFISFMNGQSHVWTGNGGDADWFNTANWEAGTVPSETSNVLISEGFSVDVISDFAFVSTLVMNANSTLSIESIFTISQSISISEEATFIFKKGTIRGVIVNSGLLLMESFEEKYFNNSSITNYGVINVVDSGTIRFNNTVNVFNSAQASIIIESPGGFLEQTGVATFNNEGLIQMPSTEMFRAYYMIFDMNNSGVIDVGENQIFLFLVSSQNLNNIATGRLEGEGTLDITSNFTNSGTFSPAGVNSIGTLDVVNNFTFSSDSTLEIEIEGSAEGEYDRMAVTGFPNLEGTIDLNLKYAPALGEEFMVITANSITSCNLTDYITAEFEGEEYIFEVQCNPTDVTLVVVSEILSVSDFSSEEHMFLIEENPVRDEVVIRLNDTFTEFGNLSITLFNNLGQEIKSQNVFSSEIVMERNALSSGIYFLQLIEGNRVLASQKIIFE